MSRYRGRQDKESTLEILLERLMDAEARAKNAEDQFKYLKGTIEQLLTRQMIITMTDDQAEKMAKAVTMYLVDKINELLAAQKQKNFVN